MSWAIVQPHEGSMPFGPGCWRTILILTIRAARALLPCLLVLGSVPAPRLFGAAAAPSVPRPPNIIFIFADDLTTQAVMDRKAELVRLQEQFGEHLPPPRFIHGTAPVDGESPPRAPGNTAH